MKTHNNIISKSIQNVSGFLMYDLISSKSYFIIIGLLFQLINFKSHAANYFSIASGNWNDGTKWSLSSGGSPANSIPGTTDNVVIQGGFTITLNGEYYCNNISIGSTGNGTLTLAIDTNFRVLGDFTLNTGSTLNLSAGYLNVKGNYICNGTINYGINATTLFNGNLAQAISSNQSTINFNNLTINNTNGVYFSTGTNINLFRNLVLTAGEFAMASGKTIFFGNGAPSTISRTSGYLNVVNSALYSDKAAQYSVNFGSGVFNHKKIGSIYLASMAAMYFGSGDTINVGGQAGYGRIVVDHLIVNGNMSNAGGYTMVSWLPNPNGNSLCFGDGTNTNNTFTVDARIDEVNKLILNANLATFNVGRNGGSLRIKSGIQLNKGTLNITVNCPTFTIDNNSNIENRGGTLNVYSASYNYGSSINVSYGGSANINISDEIKNGSSIGTLTINLTDSSKSVLTKSGTPLSTAGTLNLISGSIQLRANLIVNGNLNIQSANSIINQSTYILILSGSTPQTLSLLGGGTISFNSLTINNSTGVSLGVGTNATNLNIAGNFLLCSGTLSIGSNTFIYSGNSIGRTSGNINTDLGTINFTNTSALNLPAGIFQNSILKNLTLNGAGGVSLSENLAANGNLILSAGTLSLGSNTFTYAGNSISRTNGKIKTDSGTLVLANSSILNLPSGLFFNDAAYNLTLNGTGGVTLSGSISISNALNLSSGTLNLNGQNLTMASGAILNRANGSMSSSPVINSGSYQVIYSGSADINSTPELFPTGGGSVGNVSVNLSNSAKEISLSNSTPFSPQGNFTISAGIVNLSNLTSMQSSKVLITGSNGVLNTNGWLLLKGSSSSASASIGNSSGTINGKVMVEVAIPAGRRGYRILSHPFSENISLDSLLDDIHITGTGGNANGFDSTYNNSPSAFTFSEMNYNANNTGWSPITSTHSSIGSKETFRVFYRGPRTQPNLLNGSNPIPLAGKLTYSGTVNQGDITLNLNYTAANGNYAGWNLVGNPYPAGIDMQTMLAGNNVSATYYIWNTNGGSRGIYTAHTFGTDPVVIPVGGAFVVKATGASPSLSFHENNKTTSTPNSGLLKKETQAIAIELWSDDTIWWDRLLIKNEASSMEELDHTDAQKLPNPDVNLYSIAKDGNKLAIDSRPDLKNTKSIWLGINSSAYHFTLKLKQLNTPGLKVFLIDHFLNTKQQLFQNTFYNFDINSNSTSSGDKRFELIFEEESTGIQNIAQQELLTVYPNPVSGDRIYLTAPAHAGPWFNYQIISINGQVIQSGETGQNEGIPVESLQNGIYFLNLYNNNFEATIKLVK